MKKLVFLICIGILSCKTDKKQPEITSTENIISEIKKEQPAPKISKSDLEGHTFFRVEIENNDTILYQSCIAEIPKYSFSDKKIIHNWGQETDTLEIIDFKTEENIINYQVKIWKKNQNIQIRKTDSRLRILEIETLYTNGIQKEIFINSLFSKEIPLVKEECPEEE